MTTVDLSGHNYRIGAELVVSANLKPLMFKGFTEIVSEAQARAKDIKSLRKNINTIQMLKTVTLVTDKKQEIPMSDEILLTLPLRVGKLIYDALSNSDSAQGEILKQGDGIDSSIIYKLGTPINSSGDSITELEFHAKLYSDIEDVLAEDMPQEQTIALINKVAKPIGTKLQALPSWAIEQITIADGMFISTKILPGFLK